MKLKTDRPQTGVSSSMPELPKREELKSKRFYSEEKYHYLDNQDRIESELKDFKLEIEKKFRESTMKDFTFQRVADTDSDDDHTPQSTHRSKQMISYATIQP